MAAATLTQQAAAPVNGLRNMNAYVASSLEEWPAKGLQALVPRQDGPGDRKEAGSSVGAV